MASQKIKLIVIRSATAVDELHEIWQWNAQRYSVPHADEYLRFLKTAIDDLAETHTQGRAVSTRLELKYVLMRRKARRHGHVAVYTVDDNAVNILHVFHTAQNWRTKLTEEN